MNIYIKNINMKKIVRLTESDLMRIVRRVINEQTPVKEGRNNPLWINLVSKLKTLSFQPKILTFNDIDGIPSQSLNWGTAKSSRGKYALAIGSTDSKSPREQMDLINSDDRESQMEMINWWKKRGYKDYYGSILISFKDADKLRNDLESFFKIYPPE